VFTKIAPLLAKENIPAAAFVLSDLSRANRSELENYKKLMSMQQIKLLQQIGWTIGSHSATHANLTDKNVDLEKEVLLSKKQLERELAIPISYFAYPKGIYNKIVVQQAKKAGYSAAFSFQTGFISNKTDLFTIPRIPIDHTHTMEQFEAFFTNWAKFYFLTKQQLQRRGFLYD
jgi:peptidoglycan/xylan/chitin deacetylase (PgdA/CDA1 family)